MPAFFHLTGPDLGPPYPGHMILGLTPSAGAFGHAQTQTGPALTLPKPAPTASPLSHETYVLHCNAKLISCTRPHAAQAISFPPSRASPIAQERYGPPPTPVYPHHHPLAVLQCRDARAMAGLQRSTPAAMADFGMYRPCRRVLARAPLPVAHAWACGMGGARPGGAGRFLPEQA